MSPERFVKDEAERTSYLAKSSEKSLGCTLCFAWSPRSSTVSYRQFSDTLTLALPAS